MNLRDTSTMVLIDVHAVECTAESSISYSCCSYIPDKACGTSILYTTGIFENLLTYYGSNVYDTYYVYIRGFM